MASEREKNTVKIYLLLSASTSFCWLSESLAALPPATLGANEVTTAVVTTAVVTNAAEPASTGRIVNFSMEPLRFGGALSYTFRRDSNDGNAFQQQALVTALNGGSGIKGFFWNPWLSSFSGAIGLSVIRESTSNRDSTGLGSSISSIGKMITTSGNAQLSLLPYTNFPFEMHFNRSDTRNSNSLAIADGYESQRYGFSQKLVSQQFNSMFSWDRNTQFNERNGESRQDNLHLSITPELGAKQHLNLTGDSARSSQSRTDELSVINNLTAQHSYTPDPTISVDSTANLNQSNYQLSQGNNKARILQLSNLVVWRPTNRPLTVTGGVRLFALVNTGSNTDSGLNAFSSHSNNTNLNVGFGYDLSRFVRLNASGNLNLIDSNGEKSTSNNESMGISYSPEMIKLGNYNYNWSTSGNASRSASEQEVTQQLSLQLSHGLSRSIDMGSGSALSMNATQALSTAFGDVNGPTKQLTHTGTLSWNIAQSIGTSMLSFSISDSRNLEKGDAFQLVNFQASSNFPSGRYSSWSGSLTVQAVRQRAGNQGDAANSGFVTTSSGAISYQNLRAFGVPRLHFISDIRLNSQALLPLLSGPEESATSTWDNSLTYAIGRLQLRLNARIANADKKTNKSIMFTASRGFGNS